MLIERGRLDTDKPKIQDYGALAGNYDLCRYVGTANVLNERMRERVFESLLPTQAGRALDVACGTGRGVLVLRERSALVVGVDGTLEMLQRARAKADKPGSCFCRANAAELPFPDATFDLVSCLNFLHLFPGKAEKARFVFEIGRVLKPGGIAVIEFDNALHGLLLGPARKYFGRDIGYDWPWMVRACFPGGTFCAISVLGANLPFVWRIRWLRPLESLTAYWPVKYLARRLFVGAVRR